jgi:branched-chain amino acid transport system substrate-binding protein
MQMTDFSRRTALGLAASGAFALAMPSIVRAQNASLKIGTVIPRQGPTALHGEAAARAFQIAIDQVGNRVQDRPVELVVYDDPNPESAQANMRKLIDVDKVAAVIGGQNSSTGLAMAAVGAQTKIPTILTVPIVKEITGKNCDSHVFRCQATAETYAAVLERYTLTVGKRWYFLVGAYAYGAEAYQVMKKHVEAAGGEDLGMDSTPVGTTDFSSYILKIRQAAPDLIVLAIVGNDLATFLKQLAEFGVNIPVVCHTVGDEDLWAQTWPTGHAEVICAKFWHYNDPANSQVQRDFNDAFSKQARHPASQAAGMAWVGMRMLLEGMKQASSLDSPGIVGGLEKARPEGLPGYFRTWDHQLVWPIVVGRVRDNVSDKYDVLEILGNRPTIEEMDKLNGLQQDTLCKMSKA